ncbi:hypothetical protein CDD82_1025 [Ophiocordyceps australis]|uniref:Uncharacterized protein n=1 Tax=Ophiocordyceps australis TaxID=1399860 RepID=A0A2C5ZPH9_9HYPO|nr:hypothetical protein CDD82_1025 [Ophiocordyceps australis]
MMDTAALVWLLLTWLAGVALCDGRDPADGSGAKCTTRRGLVLEPPVPRLPLGRTQSGIGALDVNGRLMDCLQIRQATVQECQGSMPSCLKGHAFNDELHRPGASTEISRCGDITELRPSRVNANDMYCVGPSLPPYGFALCNFDRARTVLTCREFAWKRGLDAERKTIGRTQGWDWVGQIEPVDAPPRREPVDISGDHVSSSSPSGWRLVGVREPEHPLSEGRVMCQARRAVTILTGRGVMAKLASVGTASSRIRDAHGFVAVCFELREETTIVCPNPDRHLCSTQTTSAPYALAHYGRVPVHFCSDLPYVPSEALFAGDFLCSLPTAHDRFFAICSLTGTSRATNCLELSEASTYTEARGASDPNSITPDLAPQPSSGAVANVTTWGWSQAINCQGQMSCSCQCGSANLSQPAQ